MEKIKKTLPAIALKNTAVLPGIITHIDISRKASINAVEQAMLDSEKIFLIAQKDALVDIPDKKDLYTIGVVASVKQTIKMSGGAVRVLVEGLMRATLEQIVEKENYLVCEVSLFDDDDIVDATGNVAEGMLQILKETFGKYAMVNRSVNREFRRQIEVGTDLERVIDVIANNMAATFENRQKIIEAVALTDRYQCVMKMLIEETEVYAIRRDFQEKVKAKVDKNQKEYILREQQKVIREELGEDNTETDVDNFKKAVDELDASDEIKERIRKEISRFANIPSSSSESAVIRGFIETLIELPWNKQSVDNTDIKRAEKILNEQHYGLKKVKERMLEFLAVRNMTGKGEAPIICLVGPPGTGKTSIAKSVAEALEKKYVRICLGGVRDEAEIRGHRKTYVGAMPGRLITALKTAGVNNPLILLDEIDKVSSDHKGDTASALLEVLDGEQNSAFRDHYVEMPVDLSNVLFIATANSLDTIARPLLDRMEVIEVSSYTSNEKEHIAVEHLIKKQLKKNGLKKGQLEFSDKAVSQIITGYTKEAGVRNLERKIGQVCRKAARIIYEGKEESIKVTKKNLEDYLGKIKYMPEKANEKDEVGIVRGLAWTSVGGVTLEVEVNTMPGKGELKLTGQLGDVMKESAQAALSFVRSIALNYGVAEDYFSKTDIHVHIPEGATPKDGPSAGITMATAILSAVANVPVKCDVAMTGEVTLRGRVLPIGGLKEKLLAAKNAGIKTVLVPKENDKDVAEIEKEIIEGLTIIEVEKMEEVLKNALSADKENSKNNQ